MSGSSIVPREGARNPLEHVEYLVLLALPSEARAAEKLIIEDGKGKQHTKSGYVFTLTEFVGQDTFGEIRISVALHLLLETGNTSSATHTTRVLTLLPRIKCVIMCGIAGGMPRIKPDHKNIRLGDIVVQKGGLVQYDYCREQAGSYGTELTAPHLYHPTSFDSSKRLLRSVVRGIEVRSQADEKPKWLRRLEARLPRLGRKFNRPSQNTDRCFRPLQRILPRSAREIEVHLPGERTPRWQRILGVCQRYLGDIYTGARKETSQQEPKKGIARQGKSVDNASSSSERDRQSKLTPHPGWEEVPVAHGEQSDRPNVHLGRIASGNRVLRDYKKREWLRSQGVIAVEMEGAGVASACCEAAVDYLIVRGISDYCDPHKSNLWQPYAAAAAASYVWEVLTDCAHLRETEFDRSERISLLAGGDKNGVPETPGSGQISGNIVQPVPSSEGAVASQRISTDREGDLKRIRGLLDTLANLRGAHEWEAYLQAAQKLDKSLSVLSDHIPRELCIEAYYRLAEAYTTASTVQQKIIKSQDASHKARRFVGLAKALLYDER